MLRRRPLLLIPALVLLLLGLGLGLGLAPATAGAGDPVELSEWLPDWEEGMWWEVETQPVSVAAPMAPGGPLHERSKDKVLVRFTVTGSREIGGSRCWEVEVSNPIAPETKHVLYVRRRDYVLQELHTVSKTGKKEKRSVRPAGDGPYVHLEESYLCPIDLPTFPAEEKDDEVSGTLAGTKVPYVQKRRFVKKGGETTLEVTIETEKNGKPLISTQTWKKGGPWYATARRTIDGREAEVGKTVKAGTK